MSLKTVSKLKVSVLPYYRDISPKSTPWNNLLTVITSSYSCLSSTSSTYLT